MVRENPCLETATICGHHNASVVGSANVALIKGPYRDVVEQSLRSLASAEDVLVIDAADVINEFMLNKYGRCIAINEAQVFSPVNAFHFKQFVEEELANLLASGKFNTVAVFGAKPLFFDPNLLDFEYVDLFKSVIDNLRNVASENGAQVVILTFEEGFDCSRDVALTEELTASADLVFNLGELAIPA
tara:strand:+ start:232 stop:795 length:564 start_codon:yes stop_codon:yes gene_type:complete